MSIFWACGRINKLQNLTSWLRKFNLFIPVFSWIIYDFYFDEAWRKSLISVTELTMEHQISVFNTSLSDVHLFCKVTFTVFQVHPLHFCTMFCDCVTLPGWYFCSEITVTWSPMLSSSAWNMSLTSLCVAFCIWQFWMLTSLTTTSFMVCNFTIPVTIS